MRALHNNLLMRPVSCAAGICAHETRPDLDEPISLYPLEGEDVVRKLLGMDDEDEMDLDATEDDDT